MELPKQRGFLWKSGFFASLVDLDYRRLLIATASGPSALLSMDILRWELVY